MTSFVRLIGLFSLIGSSLAQVYVYNGQRRICLGSQRHGFSNICTDPISNQSQSEGPDPGSITRGFVENLLSITEAITLDLSVKTRTFENKHLPCLEHRAAIQRLNLSDVVNIQYCYPTANMNSITDMYVRLTETVKIFEILNNLNTDRCCLFSPTSNGRSNNYTNAVYSKLRNQVLAHWYILYNHRGIHVGGTSCLMKVTRIHRNHFNCDDMRNFVYVVLRHTERTLQDVETFLRELGRWSHFGRIYNFI